MVMFDYLRKTLSKTTIAQYGKTIREAPREMIFNKHLLLSTALYATSSMPLTWDQGSSSVVPTLVGFQNQFGFSNSNASQLQYFLSVVYLGAGIGALLSFFVNDRIGRLWSWRLYVTIWMIGQLIATFAPNVTALYAARVISGLGIGSLTVIGTMSIAEIAPAEVRGLLSVWFSIAMAVASVCAVFCVYGVHLHIPESRLQYQVVWFSPCAFFAIMITASFFLCESPRWLWLAGREDDAIATMLKLRGLPLEHPRLQCELQEIQESIRQQTNGGDSSSYTISVIRETFTVPQNLRRVQQAIISYALAQLSGANSITSYYVPVLRLLGQAGDTTHSLFLSGMYSFAKLGFTTLASFFFVDALGRRGSLFTGACLQMCADIYLAIFLKYEQVGKTNGAASQAALAALFIHAFGYCVGLFVLPYVFGGELWPNRIRSFGGALSQCFHWLFFFAMNFAIPPLLKASNNWGAFIFFASWCFVAIVYTFLMIPETRSLSVEELDELFKGPWFNAYKRPTTKRISILETESLEHSRLENRPAESELMANPNRTQDSTSKPHFEEIN